MTHAEGQHVLLRHAVEALAQVRRIDLGVWERGGRRLGKESADVAQIALARSGVCALTRRR